MKRKILSTICIILAVSIVLIIACFHNESDHGSGSTYNDGITQIDPNKIELGQSGARVSFSDVILSKPKEARKLVVMEQEATVSADIEKSKIRGIDLDIIKQNQTVTYTATGHFVVDLDSLSKKNILDDPDNKVLTIKIKHPRLDALEIDPNKIKVGDQSNGFLAFGDLVLSVNDYVNLEKDLQRRFKEKLDTSANGQAADDIALKMVKETFEPVVHAVDEDYSVVIEFQTNND